MIGDGARVLIERALAAIGQPADPAAIDALHDRFRERYAEVPCRFSAPYPGRPRAPGRPARGRVPRSACAPTSPMARRSACSRRSALDTAFDAVVGGDRSRASASPTPAISRAVLAALGTPPAAAVMVGDSRNDLLTARALGVPCILVSFGYTPVPARELGADASSTAWPTCPPRWRAWATRSSLGCPTSGTSLT